MLSLFRTEATLATSEYPTGTRPLLVLRAVIARGSISYPADGEEISIETFGLDCVSVKAILSVRGFFGGAENPTAHVLQPKPGSPGVLLVKFYKQNAETKMYEEFSVGANVSGEFIVLVGLIRLAEG